MIEIGTICLGLQLFIKVDQLGDVPDVGNDVVDVAAVIENRISGDEYFFIVGIGLGSRDDFFFLDNILCNAGRKNAVSN